MLRSLISLALGVRVGRGDRSFFLPLPAGSTGPRLSARFPPRSAAAQRTLDGRAARDGATPGLPAPGLRALETGPRGVQAAERKPARRRACAGIGVALLAGGASSAVALARPFQTARPAGRGCRAGQPWLGQREIQISAAWETRFEQLRVFHAQHGNANAPLNTPLGRWCKAQRRLRSAGNLSEARAGALEELGFSWQPPSAVDVDDCDWADMSVRFSAYRQENGHGQVPKKYLADPLLGGWVAAVRRRRETLGDSRVAQLDALGFEWVSVRQCGSAFMQSFRELRDFWEKHGHTDVVAVLGEGSELARWCEAQRLARRKGLLPEKRLDYLEGIGFSWE